jgi:hypothetical protein
MPGAAVDCEEEFEFQLAGFVGDGIAEDDAMSGVPESHRIEEARRIGVGVLERPMPASVAGVVDAGWAAGAG